MAITRYNSTPMTPEDLSFMQSKGFEWDVDDGPLGGCFVSKYPNSSSRLWIVPFRAAVSSMSGWYWRARKNTIRGEVVTSDVVFPSLETAYAHAELTNWGEV